MEQALAWALGVTGAVYGAAVLALTFGMFRLRRGTQAHLPTVSVVVAARDEEACIGRCLDALVAQTYPQDRIEIVVVDDRSTDRTFEIARGYEARHACVRVVRVKEERYACPKKNALSLGIAHSHGEIVLTTDADCRPGPGWVAGMVRQFGPEVGMVAGHSPPDLKASNSINHRDHRDHRGNTEGHPSSPLRALCVLCGEILVSHLLALEALAKAGLAAGSIGAGVPLSCTGRNLAYRRAAFEAVGGFERIGHIVAGDDVLLMRLIASRTGWGIRYATEPETVVPTAAGPTALRRLYHQKARHASKSLHYGGAILIPAGVIYLFHLLMMIGIPASLMSSGVWDAVRVALAGKCAVDFLFLIQARRMLGSSVSLRTFPLLEAAYVPYVVIFSLIGAMKKFQWKAGMGM